MPELHQFDRRKELLPRAQPVHLEIEPAEASELTELTGTFSLRNPRRARQLPAPSPQVQTSCAAQIDLCLLFSPPGTARCASHLGGARYVEISAPFNARRSASRITSRLYLTAREYEALLKRQKGASRSAIAKEHLGPD